MKTFLRAILYSMFFILAIVLLIFTTAALTMFFIWLGVIENVAIVFAVIVMFCIWGGIHIAID